MTSMKTQFDLSNKSAVLVGAGGPLGVPMAKALADCGARVLLVGRNGEKLQAIAESLNNKARVQWHQADASTEEGAKTIAAAA